MKKTLKSLLVIATIGCFSIAAQAQQITPVKATTTSVKSVKMKNVEPKQKTETTKDGKIINETISPSTQKTADVSKVSKAEKMKGGAVQKNESTKDGKINNETVTPTKGNPTEVNRNQTTVTGKNDKVGSKQIDKNDKDDSIESGRAIGKRHNVPRGRAIGWHRNFDSNGVRKK